MKAEKAWKAALGQLQLEMPKASYETWVRNTELVTYEDGDYVIGVQNAYARAVTYEGNQAAQAIIQRVFQPIDRNWRGIGPIPQSGWGLREEYAEFDAEKRFDVAGIHGHHVFVGEVLDLRAIVRVIRKGRCGEETDEH